MAKITMKTAIPVKILNVVIRVNPLEGIVKSFDAMNVIGRTANPNKSNTTKARPSSLGDAQPSSWKIANVLIRMMVVPRYVKKSHKKDDVQKVNTFTPLTSWSNFALLALS